MPVAGWLGARHTPRLLTLTSLAFMVTLPLPGFVTSLPALAAALLLMGACAGSMDVCMNARASRIEQGWGRAIMSSFHAAFSLGGLLGTLIVATAVGLGLGVLAGLLLTSGLLAAVTAAHFLLDPKPDLAAAGDSPAIAWPSRAVAGIGLLCLLAFLCEGAVADWSGVFLRQVAAYSAPASAAGYAAFSAAMVAARLAGDAVVRRFGPVRTLQAGGLLAASGMALGVAVAAIAPVGFALVGLGGANMAPILFSAAGRAGSAASAGVAAVATLGYGGMLLGPALVGALAEATSLRIALLLLVAAMATIALAAGRAIGLSSPP